MDALGPQVLRRLACAVLGTAFSAALWAQSPQEFVQQVNKTKGVSAVVNLREDQTLGAVAIALAPQLLADRAAVEPVLGDIGRFAVGAGYRATVVTPTAADNQFVVDKLRGAGVARITTRIMADMVSIKTSRIFLSPAP